MTDVPEHYAIGTSIRPSARPFRVYCILAADDYSTEEEAIAAAQSHASAVIGDSPEISELLEFRNAVVLALGIPPGSAMTNDDIVSRAKAIRSHERHRIADEIEAAHHPGTYPHKIAKVIRENATPDGHDLGRQIEVELAQAREKIAALEADYKALEARHGRMVDAGVELGAALTEALRRGEAELSRMQTIP